MDLARRVVPLRQSEHRAGVDDFAQLFARRVILVDEGIASRAFMVANRGIVFVADGQAVPPRRPRLGGVILAAVVKKIDRRRRRGHLDSFAKRRRRFQQVRRSDRRDRLAIRKFRRVVGLRRAYSCRRKKIQRCQRPTNVYHIFVSSLLGQNQPLARFYAGPFDRVSIRQ